MHLKKWEKEKILKKVNLRELENPKWIFLLPPHWIILSIVFSSYYKSTYTAISGF